VVLCFLPHFKEEIFYISSLPCFFPLFFSSCPVLPLSTVLQWPSLQFIKCTLCNDEEGLLEEPKAVSPGADWGDTCAASPSPGFGAESPWSVGCTEAGGSTQGSWTVVMSQLDAFEVCTVCVSSLSAQLCKMLLFVLTLHLHLFYAYYLKIAYLHILIIHNTFTLHLLITNFTSTIQCTVFTVPSGL